MSLSTRKLTRLTRVWDYLLTTRGAAPRRRFGLESLEARDVPARFGLYETGVDALGNLVATDAADPHYTLTGAGAPAGGVRAVADDGFPIGPWVGNDTNSRWVVPIGSDGDGNASPGTYDYTATVDITGFDPASVTISGQWAADDSAVILVNGKPTSNTVTGFGSLTAFTLSGFETGANTVTFRVTNNGNSDNPTGLRVSAVTGAGIPAGFQAVAGVYNTGLDATGNSLAAGATDPHYTLTSSAIGQLTSAVMVNPGAYPIGPWVADAPTSGWVAPPGASTTNADAPVGLYVFDTTFDLTGFDPSTAMLSGKWAADNQGSLSLNGGQAVVHSGSNPGSGFRGYLGLDSFQFTSGFVAGVNRLRFTVTNDPLGAGDTTNNPSGLRVDELQVLAQRINHDPVLSPVADVYTGEGQFVSFRLSATDPDGDSITYTASGLPDGLNLDSNTGVVSGIVSPAALASADTFNVLFTAGDGKGGKAQQPAKVVVVRIAPIADKQNTETDDVKGIGVLIVNQEPNEQYTYSATGLPAGVDISPITGVISSSPAIKYSDAPTDGVNTHQVRVTATDSKGKSITYPFTWKVNDKNPLAVIDDRSNKVGDNVVFTPTVLSANLLIAPVGYTVTFDVLPAGVVGANNAANGKTAAAATKIVTATINDGGQIHTRQFFWTVTDPAGQRIEGPSVVPGNTVYRYTVYWNQDIADQTTLVSVGPGVEGGDTAGVTVTPFATQVVDGKTASIFDISYPNRAAKFVVTAKLNGQTIAMLPITDVQIVFGDPSAAVNGIIPPGFTRGKVVEELRGGLGGGPDATRGVYAISIQAGETVLEERKPGLAWKGTYGVVGPNGGQGTSQIQLGFIQHVTINASFSTYADGKTLTANYDGQALAGKTFLDGRGEASGPWYGGESVTPSATKTSGDFGKTDSPNVFYPLSSDQTKAVNGVPPVIPVEKMLLSTNYSTTFTLDFAVRTLDPQGSSQYFSEARALWYFYANGTIGAAGGWVGNAGNQGAIINSPNSWAGLNTTIPTLIDTTGPIANSILDKLTFVASGP